MNFPKYSLNAKQIRGLANIVQHEQGSKAGFYAEASLMANLTDITGDQNATVEKLIKKATGGWFAYGKSRYNAGYNGTVSVSQVAIDAVTNCIVNGRRTLPRYVNEHDCLSDIKSVTNGTKNNKQAWKPHTTILHNRYGSNWRFYSFPGGVKTGVDPFGYTSITMRNKWGEDCYTVTESEKGEQYMGFYTKPLHDPKTTTVGTIKVGVKGKYVGEVQDFINTIFGCQIAKDENCGPRTESYIILFQKHKGLDPDGKWGHDTWYAAKNATLFDMMMCHMIFYNQYVKANGQYFVRDTTPDKPFSVVRSKVEAKKKAKICCNAPIRWAFADMGFNPIDIWAKDGSFSSKYTGDTKKHFTRTTSGGAVGKTIKYAVEHKLLKKGDIIAFKGITHTFMYTGSGYKMYDGGEAAEHRGYKNVGITLDYTDVAFYKGKTISEILRWKV